MSTAKLESRFDLQEGISVLERTPRVLTAWLSQLPESWLVERDGQDGWNAREVLAHLIHGERTDWIPRARIILSDGPSRPFEPFDRTANFAAARTIPIDALLADFQSARHECLLTLRGWALTADQLALPGTHPDLGRVTLGQLLATWVAHDLTHLAQIARTMARRYREQVGPWRAYFNSLK
jgi:hypothetical protein